MTSQPEPKRERQGKPNCVHCGHWDSSVFRGFYEDDTRAYVRWRKCKRCLHNFQTEETIRKRTYYI